MKLCNRSFPLLDFEKQLSHTILKGRCPSGRSFSFLCNNPYERVLAAHVSYHLMACHIMSYHIISYHVIAYHGISWHIIDVISCSRRSSGISDPLTMSCSMTEEKTKIRRKISSGISICQKNCPGFPTLLSAEPLISL